MLSVTQKRDGWSQKALPKNYDYTSNLDTWPWATTMPHVVIVGDRGSGKTTVLALLYAAQVKSGATRADDFRFHVGLESLEEISEVFQQLMSGSFPDSAAKEGISSITSTWPPGRPDSDSCRDCGRRDGIRVRRHHCT